jgi:hypothetical protein
VFEELDCGDKAMIWGKVANLVETAPELLLCSLFSKGLWFSAFLEVDRAESQTAKSCFVRLMVEQKKLKELVSLPLKISAEAFEEAVTNAVEDVDKRTELLSLLKVVVYGPTELHERGSNECTSPSYKAITEVLRLAQEEPLDQSATDYFKYQGTPALISALYEPKSKVSESCFSSVLSSPGSFLDIKIGSQMPSQAPLDASSIKPKRLNFLSPGSASASPMR